MHSEKQQFHKYGLAITLGLMILGVVMVIGSIIGIELQRIHTDSATTTTVPVSPIPTPNAPTMPSTLLDINENVISELISFQVYNFQPSHYYTLGFYNTKVIIVIKHVSDNPFETIHIN